MAAAVLTKDLDAAFQTLRHQTSAELRRRAMDEALMGMLGRQARTLSQVIGTMLSSSIGPTTPPWRRS